MKHLPKVYKNESINTINNNKQVVHITNNNNSNLNDKYKVLEEIFNGIGQPYNKKVIINTNNNIIETYIVSRNNINILTIDNDIIPIENIISIEIKN